MKIELGNYTVKRIASLILLDQHGDLEEEIIVPDPIPSELLEKVGKFIDFAIDTMGSNDDLYNIFDDWMKAEQNG